MKYSSSVRGGGQSIFGGFTINNLQKKLTFLNHQQILVWLDQPKYLSEHYKQTKYLQKSPI
jgi:hypothetical protein